jgi:hypothetical protein
VVVGGEHETVAGNGNRESDGAAIDLSEAKVRAGLGMALKSVCCDEEVATQVVLS